MGATNLLSTVNPGFVSELSAIDLANLLLATALRRGGLVLEPGAQIHAILLESAGTRAPLAAIPSALGDAAIARLAILAGLDVSGAASQIGRLRLTIGAHTGDLIVELRATPLGLCAELHRMAGLEGADLADPHADAKRRISVYKILDEVGRGGMGVVYRAVHEALARPVAIKVLYAQYAHDPEIATRFVREARAASRARHEGIVDVFDFGLLPDGRAFLVMELVEARTLEVALEQDGPLEPARVIDIARGIARALGAAHAAGVVHRNLKPANVFLEEDDAVKLADFGAAKLVGPESGPSETQPGSVFGTPYYMSPEHARGHATDARTNLYALGCVMFELLTGVVPFEGETSMDVLMKHITAPVPPITSKHGAVPDGLAAIVTRALAKRPINRYQTAEELATDLERLNLTASRTGWRRWLPVSR